MRRIIALVAIALAATFVGVAGVPASPAHALNCTNSLTCNPANAPILTELGIITTKGGTSIVAPAAATSSGSAAIAGVNWSFAVSTGANLLFGGAATALGVGYMASNGWGEQELTINPDYFPEDGAAYCRQYPTVPSAFAPGVAPTCNLASTITSGNSSYPLGHYFDLQYTITDHGLNGQGRAFATVKIDVNGTRPPGEKVSPSYGGTLQMHCYSGTGSSAGTGTYNYSSGVVSGSTATRTCPAGGTQMKLTLSSSNATENGNEFGVIYDSRFPLFSNTGDGPISGDVRSTVECMKPDTTIYNVYKIEPFIVVGDDPVPVPDARCAPGELAVGGTVEWRPTGTTDWFDVLEADVPPAVREWMTDYPNCFGMAQACAIQLLKKNTAGDWETCGTIGEYCEDWASTDPDLMHERYQCRYGGKVADINLCSAYRKPSAGVLPNTDKQGNPIPPNAPPPSQPINPKTDEQLVELGLDDLIDTTGRGECWPSGWGVLNPLSWVYMPLQCFAEWATIPRTSVLTKQLTDIRTAWSTIPPVRFAAAVTGWQFVPPASGCGGIAVSMDWMPVDVQDVRFFDACPGALFAPYAGWAKLLISLGTVVLGAVSIQRSVAGVVEFNS